MSKAKLLAVLACASSLFAGNALAATPLTRYFPDLPLAVIEAKDLLTQHRLSAYTGQVNRCPVVRTILRGRTVWPLTGEKDAPRGRWLRPG